MLNSIGRRKERQTLICGFVALIVLCVTPVFLDRPAKIFFFSLTAILGFFAWIALYRHYRLLHDLPTSRIASAAQGYVELVGCAQALPGRPLLSPVSRQPCCWYRFSVHRQRESDPARMDLVERGSSTEPLLLVDETGICAILPEDVGNVFTDHDRIWREGEYCYSESMLLPGEVLYAAGELTTVSVATAAPALKLDHDNVKALLDGRRKDRERKRDVERMAGEHTAVGVLIARWKTDRKRLHEHFDLDRDGAIDMKEWEQARTAARREVRRRPSPPVERREAANPTVEGIPMLRKPRDGRPFLLARGVPEQLGNRARFGAWLFFFVFLYDAAGLLLLL